MLLKITFKKYVYQISQLVRVLVAKNNLRKDRRSCTKDQVATTLSAAALQKQPSTTPRRSCTQKHTSTPNNF